MKKLLLLCLFLVLTQSGFMLYPNGSICCSQGTKTTQATTAATIAVKDLGNDAIHRTVITFTASPVISALGTGNILYGAVGTTTTTAVYTFPKGNIQILGAELQSSGTPKLTCGVTGAVLVNYTGLSSLGTVPTANDATLTGTEANILPSTAIAAAATKIATVHNVDITAPTAPIYKTTAGDGTTTALPLFVNFIVDADAGNTAGTCTFTGTATIVWSNLTNN
jgi:hypothetical protein